MIRELCETGATYTFDKTEALTELPPISIVMIRSRSGEMYDTALRSLESQLYPKYEVVEVDNMDLSKSIGEAWNEGVRRAKYDYVLFFDDDDIIVPGYLMQQVGFLYQCVAKCGEMIDCVHSCLTFIRDGSTTPVLSTCHPVGMWKRTRLIEFPFSETAQHPDLELFERIVAKVKNGETGFYFASNNANFGYFYRQHPGNHSGYKLALLDEKHPNWWENNKLMFITEPELQDPQEEGECQ